MERRSRRHSSPCRKRSTRSKVCGWLRGFFGCLIVLGLITVFYFIAATIIDGSTPLDFLWSDETIPVRDVNYENSIKNRRNESNSGQNTRISKDKDSASVKIPEDRTDIQNRRDKSDETNKKITDNHRSNIGNHTDDDSLLAAGRYVTNRKVRPTNLADKKVLTNRYGSLSPGYDERLHNVRSSNTHKRDPRPSQKAHSSLERYKTSSNSRFPTGDYISSVNSHQKYLDELRNKMLSSVRRRYELTRRPNRNRERLKYSDRNLRDEDQYLASHSTRIYSRQIPKRKLQRNERPTFGSSIRRLFSPRTRDETARSYSESRQRNSYSGRHKPPDKFRYPSSAESIQDIIEFMKKDKREEPNSNYRSNGPRLKKIRYVPSYYDGEENDDFVHREERYYHNSDEQHFENDKYFTTERYPSSVYITNNDFDDNNNQGTSYYEDDLNHQYNSRPKNKLPSNSYVLPPVRNEPYVPYVRPRTTTYKPYTPSRTTTYSSPESKSYLPKSKEDPMKIIIDIYPSSESTRAVNPLKTLMYLSSKLLNYNSNYGSSSKESSMTFSRIGNQEEEIVLHLNLFSLPKNTFSYPGSFEDQRPVSVDIPLTGKLTSMDVYKAIVSQTRTKPTASAHVDNTDNKKPELEEDIKIELNDVEEGYDLFKAIDRRLKDINPHLPPKKKIIFTEDEITKEDFSQLRQNSESNIKSSLRVNSSSVVRPSSKVTDLLTDVV